MYPSQAGIDMCLRKALNNQLQPLTDQQVGIDNHDLYDLLLIVNLFLIIKTSFLWETAMSACP